MHTYGDEREREREIERERDVANSFLPKLEPVNRVALMLSF